MQKVTKTIKMARYDELQQTIPGTDSALSNACDDFIELRDEVIKLTKNLKDAKEARDDSNSRVAELMLKIGMMSCLHHGLTFKVKELKEVKPKVIVKEGVL